MQMFPAAFLALLLAHLLGDFLFQPEWMVRNKARDRWALFLHGAIHYALALTCLLLFASIPLLSLRNQAVLLACVAIHMAIDALKSLLITRSAICDDSTAFLTDQALHVTILTIAALIFTGAPFTGLAGLLRVAPQTKSHLLEATIVYVAVVFGGGYLIRYITRGIAHEIAEETPEQLGNAGLYIGWLERTLVITAMAMQSPALVGLILTGKSIARFPEFKEARFAEYFLIGTLLSFVLSIAGGIVLLRLFYGTVVLK